MSEENNTSGIKSAAEIFQSLQDSLNLVPLSESATNTSIESIQHTSTFLYYHATTLASSGLFLKAQPLLEECFLIRNKVNPASVDTMECLHMIAKNQCMMSQFQESLKSYKEVLKLCKTISGNSSNSLAEILLSFANNLRSQCLYHAAFKYYSDTSKIITTIYDSSLHNSTAILGECFSQQAFNTMKLGKVEEAKAMIDRAVAILTKSIGMNHITTVEALFYKAEILRRAGKFQDASTLHEQVFVARRRLCNESHPLIATSLLFFGLSLYDIGKPYEGRQKLILALQMRLVFYPVDDLQVAEVQHHLGWIQLKIGMYKEAEDSIQQSLRIRQDQVSKLASSEYPSASQLLMSDSYQLLGELNISLGQFDKAVDHLNRSLQLRNNLLLSDGTNETAITAHPLIAEVKYWLGVVQRMKGEYKPSRQWIEQCCEENRIVLGKEHSQFLYGQYELTQILLETNEADKAMKLNKRTMQTLKVIHPSGEHQDFIPVYRQQAEILLATGKGQGPEPINQAMEVMKKASELFLLIFDKVEHHLVWIEIQLLTMRLTALKAQEVSIPVNPLMMLTPQDSAAIISNPVEGVDQPKDSQETLPVKKFDSKPYNQRVADVEHYLYELHKGMPMSCAIHPWVEIIHGSVGMIRIEELLAKKAFMDSLSVEEKLLVLMRESEDQAADNELRTPVSKPQTIIRFMINPNESPATTTTTTATRKATKKLTTSEMNLLGVRLIEKVVRRLQNDFKMTALQPSVKIFFDRLDTFQHVPDELESALIMLQEGNQFRLDGKFSEADRKYDASFVLLIQVLGPMTASSSSYVAEVLYSKAEVSRLQGTLQVAKVLYQHSTAIFRKQIDNKSQPNTKSSTISNQKTVKDGILRCLKGVADGLYTQGYFEEALTMHQKALSGYVSLVKVDPVTYQVTVGMLHVAIAYDLYQLGRYEIAWKEVQFSYSILQSNGHHDGSKMKDHLASVHSCLALITNAIGAFDVAQSHWEKAMDIREKLYPAGDHYRLAEVWKAKLAYLFHTQKLSEAVKLSNQLLKLTIKIYGRSGNEGTSDQKTVFYEKYDQFAFDTINTAKKSHATNRTASSDKTVPEPLKSQLNSTDFDWDQDVDSLDGSGEPSAMPPPVGSKTSMGGASSILDHVIKEDGSKPSFVYRGFPIRSNPYIAWTLYEKSKISMALYELGEAMEYLDAALLMFNQTCPSQPPSARKLSIQFEFANLIILKGSYEEAKVLHESIFNERMQLYENPHPDVPDSMIAIAKIAARLCKYEESTQILSEALILRRKIYEMPEHFMKELKDHHPTLNTATLNQDHWKVCEVLLVCAEVLYYRGLYSDSKVMFEQTLSTIRKLFGYEVNLWESMALLGLSQNCRELGQYDQCFAYLEQAAAIQTIITSETHPDAVQYLYEQSCMSRLQGKFLECKRQLEECIASQRAKLGKYHPSTIITLLGLAQSFTDIAKYDTAVHVFNRATQLLGKTLGKDNILVAHGLTGQAENYKCQGFYVKAKESHEKALYIRRKILGDKHPQVAESLHYLSELLIILAKYDEALKGLDDVFAIQRMSFGTSHPMIARSMHSHGKILIAQGKIMEGKYLHEKAMTMRKSTLSSSGSAEHPLIGDSQYRMAETYKQMGKLDQSAALFQRSLHLIRNAYGSRHPYVATVLCQLGLIQNQMGKFSQASEYLKEALDMQMVALGPMNQNHPDILETQFGIAENLRYRGLYEYVDLKAIQEFQAMNESRSVRNENANRLNPQESADVDELLDKLLVSRKKKSDTVNDSKPKEEGKEAPPMGAGVDEHSASAPTVMISAIERLDNDIDENDPDLVLPQDMKMDSGNSSDDFDSKRALPIYKEILDQQLEIYSEEHPIAMQTQFAIAETLKLMGRLEDAQELHEELLLKRRKLLSESHPDTIMSMFAVGDLLRLFGKLYPDTPTGAMEAKQEVKKVTRTKEMGVSLQDQLCALTLPLDWDQSPLNPASTARPATGLPGKAKKTIGGGFSISNDSNAGAKLKLNAEEEIIQNNWVFLSPPPELIHKPLRPALRIRRGYMGYEFPVAKKLELPEATTTATRPRRVLSGDVKWLYDTSFNMIKKLMQGDPVHPINASILYSKGELMKARKDYPSARHLFEQSLNMRRRIVRGNHPGIAQCLCAMAEIFRIENKFQQAAPLYDKALEIYLGVYANGLHVNIADVKNCIGMMNFARGKYFECESNFKEALAICKAILGRNHPSLAVILSNYGMLLCSLGKYLEAGKHLLEAHQIKMSIYGPNHAEVAGSLNNLGSWYKAQKKYVEAEKSFQSAMEIQEKVFGNEHPDYAVSLNNMAALYVLMGNVIDAKGLYRQSIGIRTAYYGLNHPSLASTLNNYGGLLMTMREYDAAKESFDDALRIRVKTFGETHPTVGETLNNIGYLQYKQNNLSDAITTYEKALEIELYSYGSQSRTVGMSMSNLGGLHHKVGHFEDALELYVKALDIHQMVSKNAKTVESKAIEENLANLQKEVTRLQRRDPTSKLLEKKISPFTKKILDQSILMEEQHREKDKEGEDEGDEEGEPGNHRIEDEASFPTFGNLNK